MVETRNEVELLAFKNPTRRERALVNRTRWDSFTGEMLLEIFLMAKNRGQIIDILDNILTDTEWQRINNRLFAIHLFALGASYREINRSTGLNSEAIARFSKKLYRKRGPFYSLMRKVSPNYSD